MNMTKPPDSFIWPNTFILDCVPAKLEPEHVGLQRPTRTRDIQNVHHKVHKRSDSDGVVWRI
ncbi:hypothetical protein [Cupriavidus basilensis]|uniref:hypothetical protein n=1 Tax=Cupriavidus basilensis TaxID=68895 RepID=UPI0039F64BF0